MKCEPFIHWIVLEGLQGEEVRVRALFNGGAMVGVMDKALWEKHRHRLGGRHPSRKTLRMASGALVPSEATWEGVFELEGV
jgi:hypothetical protein